MKTLDEHNAIKMQLYCMINANLKNDIACPRCGEEMIDSKLNVVLTSYPLKKQVTCEKCSFNGYAII